MNLCIHNEKNFTIGDTQFYTVFAANRNMIDASPLHTHSQYEMFLFAEGRGYVDFGSSKETFKKGTAILISPSTEHSVICADSEPVISMSVSFSFKKAGSSKRLGTERVYRLFDSLIPKAGEYVVMKDKFFSNFVRSFSAQSEPNPELASLLISNMLESLFLHVIRVLSKNSKSPINVPICSYTTSAVTNDIILAKNIEYYMNSLSCTLTELSHHLNMCPRNTQKVLRKIFGMSFSEMMAEKRLSRAIRLMKSTELSLCEISKAVCYNQYPSFRKAFIAKYGKSPQIYRAELEQQSHTG